MLREYLCFDESNIAPIVTTHLMQGPFELSIAQKRRPRLLIRRLAMYIAEEIDSRCANAR